MKKILGMISLLIVCMLLIVGCGKRKVTTNVEVEREVVQSTTLKETVIQETEKEEETTKIKEEKTTLKQNKETSKQEKSTKQQKEGSSQSMQTEQRTETTTALITTQQTETQPKSEPETKKPKSEPETKKPKSEPETKKKKPEKTESVSYSPQKVVELAIKKTKKNGKTYIPDDLDKMLAAGEITQEDYSACYPTDGAGYVEYYVAADMNEARDISGTVQFNSESDIAADIAGMYAALPQQYFYIEYHGTDMYGGKECHVFYCYRA